MSRQVVVVEPGRGDRVGNVEFLARTVDTPFFNLSEVVLRPGQGVESHVHQSEDDSWLVLDGTLSVTVGEDARRIEAGPGTFVLVPSGTAHELRNCGSTDVRFLNVHAPGGFDRRLGWRPRRRHGVVASTLAVLAVLLLTAGGPASAAGLTKAKVQQLAASVVAQKAPSLSVAHATSADSATWATRATIAATASTATQATTATTAGQAANAARLGGAEPSVYLDTVVHGQGESGALLAAGFPAKVVVKPISIATPSGIGFVRVTGVVTFEGPPGSGASVFFVNGTSCAGPEESSPWYYGRNNQYIVIDRVLEVSDPTETFVLCAVTEDDAVVFNPTLTVETVAHGGTFG